MSFRDENGAGYAAPGTDPESGVDYIIDLRTHARVYLAGPCPRCGCTMLSSVPKPADCGACALGRIARNDDVVDLVIPQHRLSAQAIENPCDHGSASLHGVLL
jgi:hypothetical protein